MARINQCGFELNSLTAGVEFIVANGSPTIQTSIVRSGTYALKIASLTSATAMGIRFEFGAAGAGGNGPWFCRTYFYVVTLPTAENRIISQRDSVAGADKLYITIDSGGLLRLYNNANTQIGSASSALNLNQWYRIEYKIDRTPANGSQIIEASLEGVIFATSSAQTIATNAGDLMRVGGNLNLEAQTQGEWYFDDLAVNDNTGSFQTAYPGSGKIIHLKPNATGDTNAFLVQVGGTAGSANNFTRVNEIPPDDATSYNASAVLGAEDLFNCDNSTVGSNDTINVVAVGGRHTNLVAADATASFEFELIKTSGGTKAIGTAIIPNTTNWRTNLGQGTAKQYPLVTYQDPDSINWTKVTLDSMQIGYTENIANTSSIAITNVWASVDYAPANTTTVSQLSILGAG